MSRSLVGLVLMAAAVGGLAAAAPDWWSVQAEQSPEVTVAGAAVLGRGLALAVLAGSVLGWLLHGMGRRILGVVMVLLGIGMVAAVLAEPLPSELEVLTELRQVSLASEYTLVRAPWPWLHLACGGVVSLAGAALAYWSLRWPSASRRFETGDSDSSADSTGGARAAEEPSLDLWRSLDEGQDPTVDDDQPEESEPGAEPATPDYGADAEDRRAE